jgi:rhomboid family GlyGly-CTERM serine protease
MGLDKAAQNDRLSNHWFLAAGATVIFFALQLGGDSVREALAYSREFLAAGEFWRLATGHFVHLGWTHLLLNLAGLALVSWLVGPAYNWRQWLYVTGISVATIDAGFWFLYPELAWYVGLSGLLHGLLTAGLFPGLLARDRESLILVAFVAAKLIWEQTGGPLPGSEITSGGTVIVDAHLYGALGGLIAASLMWRRVRPTSSI